MISSNSQSACPRVGLPASLMGPTTKQVFSAGRVVALLTRPRWFYFFQETIVIRLHCPSYAGSAQTISDGNQQAFSDAGKLLGSGTQGGDGCASMSRRIAGCNHRLSIGSH